MKLDALLLIDSGPPALGPRERALFFEEAKRSVQVQSQLWASWVNLI